MTSCVLQQQIYSIFLFITTVSCLLLAVAAESNTFIARSQHNKLKYHDVWYEINDSIILNCSLRVGKDQHIVWHRKYEKMGVHVLTIGSETFISDLRIRPIKEHFDKNNEILSRDQQAHSGNVASSSTSNELIDSYDSQIDTTTWNLQIRRLKREDAALYYCVLNSENSYGQIYRVNVIAPLKLLNSSEIFLNNSEYAVSTSGGRTAKHGYPTFTLVCKYDDVLINTNEQIKWYFNKFRIKSDSPATQSSPQISRFVKDENGGGSSDENTISAASFKMKQQQNQPHNTISSTSMTSLTSNHHFTIIQRVSLDTNTTTSILLIHNFNSKYNTGKYKCQYKGISKTVRVYPGTRQSESQLRIASKYTFASSSSSSSASTLSSFLSSPMIVFTLLVLVLSSLRI